MQVRFQAQQESASIMLYDMYGRTVLSQKAASAISVTLDLKALPTGTYSYKVVADGHTYNGKIIKR